ncbi:MAG: hypothetical protein JNM31_14705 [Flavobacteriales bacterium]|nr:hypothetical protein [Flavobacteriales bacterium]
MSFLRSALLCLSLSYFLVQANAQDTAGGSRGGAPWTLEPSLLTILYRDTITLWNPAFNADHGRLHLEARYQWEDWRTASVWAGRWFGFGEALHVDMAPIAGFAFGNTMGVGGGLVVEAAWKNISFSTSSEYLVDLDDQAYNFTYNWSEIAVDLDHLLVGIVTQRTRTWISPLDLQRGLLLMREQGALTFGMYLFNIGWTDPTVAFTLSYAVDTKP